VSSQSRSKDNPTRTPPSIPTKPQSTHTAMLAAALAAGNTKVVASNAARWRGMWRMLMTN